MSHTLSASREQSTAALAGAGPCLFLVLQLDQLRAPSLRIALEQTRGLRIGRGAVRALQPAEGGTAELSLADSRVSSHHCRLLRLPGGWAVEDLGSKNGTLVNGKPAPRALLRDGDLLETGRTFFLYREAVELEAGAPLAAAVDEAALPPGLATLQPGLGAALARLQAVSGAAVPVVIQGESGTGKELVAAAVHLLSGRGGPFQAVNCGALPATLLASELFGYRRGAFSGADEDRPGLIRTADRGTLFLDEIGDLPQEGQLALLRVLQEGEVHPLGAPRPVKVDVRLVAATHRDLARQVAAGRIREDLYARLSGFRLALPPLRERREDFGLFVASILRRRLPGAGPVVLASGAARALLGFGWPLNIRQLEQSLLTAVALAQGGTVEQAHLALDADPRPGAAPAPAPAPAEEDPRREELLALLEKHGGNVSQVAAEMGKARTLVHKWIKRAGIDARLFRG